MGVNGRSVASANCRAGCDICPLRQRNVPAYPVPDAYCPLPLRPHGSPCCRSLHSRCLELRSVRIADAGRSPIVAGTDRIHARNTPDATESNRKQKNRPHTLADLRRHPAPPPRASVDGAAGDRLVQSIPSSPLGGNGLPGRDGIRGLGVPGFRASFQPCRVCG